MLINVKTQKCKNDTSHKMPREFKFQYTAKWKVGKREKYLLGERHTKNVLHPYHIPEIV